MAERSVVRIRRLVLFLLLAALFTVFWFSPSVAWIAAACADYVVPRITSEYDYRVEAVGMSGVPDDDRDDVPGIMLALSPERARWILMKLAGVWRFLIPPGLFQDGLSVSGRMLLRAPADLAPLSLPVTIRLDKESHYPTLKVRFPRSRLNAIAARDGFLGDRQRRKEYALGHYDLRNRYLFRSLRVASEPPDSFPVTERRVNVYVSGQVRYWFDDSILSVRSTAELRPSQLRVNLGIETHPDGISVSYNARFASFDANFNNVMPAMDAVLSEKLRESLESTLNRRRKVERMAARRLPHWAPMDLMLDVKLVDG